MKTKTANYFSRWAKSYDAEHKDYPVFMRWQNKTIFGQIDFSKNPRILDLGTGTGRLILEAGDINPNAKLYAVDISSGMLKKAKKNAQKHKLKINFKKISMDELPFKSNFFDYVISNQAVHHVRAKKRLFSEIYRVLKPNGKMIISDFFEKYDSPYLKKCRQIKEKYPDLAKKFKKSLDDAYGSLSDQEKGEHPPEYYLKPEKLKRMLKEVGFKEVKIIHSYDKYLAVYQGRK